MTKKGIFNLLTTLFKIIWDFEKKNRNQSFCLETKGRKREMIHACPLSLHPVAMPPADSNIPASQWPQYRRVPRAIYTQKPKNWSPARALCTTAGLWIVSPSPVSAGWASEGRWYWYSKCPPYHWQLVQPPAHMTLGVSSKVWAPQW